MKLEFTSFATNAAFVVAPVVGFLPQIVRREILFSPILSLLIVVSNMARVYYWQLERFNFCLVVQSVCLVFLHNLLIAMHGEELSHYESLLFRSLFPKRIRSRGGLFLTHIQIVTLAVAGVYALHYVVDSTSVLTLCKYVNLVLDTGGSAVQFLLAKYDRRPEIPPGKKRKSPKELFLCWIVGDTAKFFWLLKKATPTMIASMAFQLVINCFLFYQSE